MADLTLYHLVRSRSSVALWLLEELGVPYDVEILDMQKGENRAPAFLAINPMGKVPVIRHGDVTVSELAAIALYLSEVFPEAGLGVKVGDPRRAALLKWLFFGPGVLEPAVMDRTFKRAEAAPRQALGYGDFDTTMDVMAKAVETGPYLLGEQFTVADIVIGSNLRWSIMAKFIPERPEFTAYVERLSARPALQRADEKDAEFAARS